MKTPEELTLDDLGSVVGGTEDQAPCFVYVIRPGDCLSVIAHKYGCTVKRLQEINGIVNPDRITPGDTLLIPYLY